MGLKSNTEGEVEVREERGRVEEGGIEVMGGVEGYGKKGGGMTKGDSCNANPIHPLAHMYTLLQSVCIICPLSPCSFSYSTSSFPVLLSAALVVVVFWRHGGQLQLSSLKPTSPKCH